MSPIASYARLIGEHAEIARRVADFCDALANAAAADIRASLDHLADALIDHLATEDQSIHPRLMTARDGGTRLAAEAAQRRYETLGDDWLALIDHWTEAHIAADRHGFAEAAGALIERLRGRIVEEDELLYPAALATGQMALRG